MPALPNRKTLRLAGYDYAENGLYFITICVQSRQPIFGRISDESMICNAAGEMIAGWWQRIATKFVNIEPLDFVVMPNHFHGLLVIDRENNSPQRSVSIPKIIQWFKIMTTNVYMRGVKELGWQAFEEKLWQRSYHDHIVRSEQALLKIQQYIQENPLRWKQDSFYDRK